MRIVLLALLVLLMSTESAVEAKPGAVWRGKALHVYDHSSAAWDGVFAQTVDDANAILPPRAPRVVYHRMAHAPCDALPTHRRGITICSGGDMRWKDNTAFANSAGFTTPRMRKRVIFRATVWMTEGYWQRAKVACHELIGHAILGIPDAYNSKMPEESCVHASAETPGTWDAAVARWLYKHLDHHSGPRHRTRRKH